MQPGLIKNTLIIFVILGVTYFSQQAHFKELGNGMLSEQTAAIEGYLAKGANWVSENVYPTITGEVQKRGDIIKNEVAQEKENISKNIGEKIQNYFSGIVDSVINPGSSDSCQPSQASTSSNQ